MRPLDFDGDGPAKRRRQRDWRREDPENVALRKEKYRTKKSEARRRCIAILDLETDPFDNGAETPVFPFLAVLYSDQFPTVTIWENDWQKLVAKLMEVLDELDEPFTIYAHNGGRFDFMYFMHVIGGAVKFKGRSLMSAKLGRHEIRDSLHIIPESLKNANRKDEIDYKCFAISLRERHRKIITDYCISDCVYTFEIVRAFIDRFGMPITIGQAAMAELKKHYTIKRLTEGVDRYMRQWFFGGRVECISKAGRYQGEYKLYDVNSMYPSVMATTPHPIGDDFLVNDAVGRRTAFVHLRCSNRGALVSRTVDGSLSAAKKSGEFFTTIHEYRTAVELGLIREIRIIKTIDFSEWSDFSKFVLPIYERREQTKAALALDRGNKTLEQSSKFDKYILNNAYGKLAQNPRRFKDHFITAPEQHPDLSWLYLGAEVEARRTDRDRFTTDRERIQHHNRLHAMSDDEKTAYWLDRTEHVKRLRSLPAEETNGYWIFSRPSLEWRFNNVAAGASITGAARAKLLRARHFAVDPLYCDTDSLVCRDLHDHDLSPSILGAWKQEAEIVDFIMTGKKVYGYRTPEYDGKTKDRDGNLRGEVIKAKGMQGVTWQNLLDTLAGHTIPKKMMAPTLTRAQTQHYMTRDLRATYREPIFAKAL